ncbi:hypothetical protein BU16DRAFT_331998 [Lophium mytilinum]|uniref:Uncharacterized protein n=1 Tax=Lophium mytilinum TaxID=390894 RepID=A0A6A6R255_9PEZI|nr:hypothetical protein BU16DRAFT_331998 [Lophium mytilinum]
MLVTCLQTPISAFSISGNTLMCSDCVQQTIYETAPAAGTAYYNYFCAEGYSALTIFRETPGTSSSFSSTVSEPSSTTSAISTSEASTTPTPSPSPSPAASKTNQAWIAGPVLGAAAFVIACAALWYLVHTRRRRPKPYEQQREFTMAQHIPSEIDGRSLAEMGMR